MPQLIYSEKVWRVLDSYRGLLNFEAYYSSLFLAHMALDLRVNPEDVIESEFLNSQVKTIFLRSLDKAPNADRLFSFAREWMEQFTENEITNLVINTSPLPFTSRATSADTSNSVLPLLNELMKKSKPKRCMDFCSGVGNAMILMARNGATEVHGIEINQSLPHGKLGQVVGQGVKFRVGTNQRYCNRPHQPGFFGFNALHVIPGFPCYISAVVI